MDIKLYLFILFILIASSVIPVLVYSNEQRPSIQRKPSNANLTSVATEVKKESKSRPEKLDNGKSSSVISTAKPKLRKASVSKQTAKTATISLNKELSVSERPLVVGLPAWDEQVEKPSAVNVYENGEDDLLLAADELNSFFKLADQNDTIPPGHPVLPSKEEKMTIVPIPVTTEEINPFKFFNFASYVPDIIKVLPFNFAVKSAVMRPDIGSPQGLLEPEWFKPKQKPKPNVNYAKNSTMVGRRAINHDDSEELLLDMLGNHFNTHWPKILGPPPDFGPYRRKNKDRPKTKVKPQIINTPKDAHDKVVKIKRDLTLGAMCRFSSECKSRCCLRLPTKKENVTNPQRCRPLARKSQPCAIEQLKAEVYVGNCPCLAGDAHCKTVSGMNATCDA